MDEASHTVLAHERLAIVDLENGAQPLTNETDTVWLSVNGEIYNRAPLNPLVHTTLTSAPDRYLRQDLRKKYKFKTNSDCEPIIYLVRLPLALMHCRLTPPLQYEEFGTNFLNRLSGDFVFVLYDVTKKRFMAARDPMGVCPLYVGYGKDGSTWFASEMKVRSLLSAFYIDLSLPRLRSPALCIGSPSISPLCSRYRTTATRGRCSRPAISTPRTCRAASTSATTTPRGGTPTTSPPARPIICLYGPPRACGIARSLTRWSSEQDPRVA